MREQLGKKEKKKTNHRTIKIVKKAVCDGAPRRAGHDWVSGRSHGAQVAQRGAPRPEAGSPGPRRGTEKTKPRRQREGRAALCVAAGQSASRHPAHGGQRGGAAPRPLRSAARGRPASGGHRSPSGGFARAPRFGLPLIPSGGLLRSPHTARSPTAVPQSRELPVRSPAGTAVNSEKRGREMGWHWAPQSVRSFRILFPNVPNADMESTSSHV